MTRIASILALALLLGTHAARAADKDEEKAKATAVAFAKAVKAKDPDAAVKLIGTPFLLEKGKDAELVEKAADVKAELKTVFGRVDPARVPTKVKTVIPAAKIGEAFKEKMKGRELIEKAIGKDGFAILMTLDSGKSQIGFVVLVAPRDGGMKVVGMVD